MKSRRHSITSSARSRIDSGQLNADLLGSLEIDEQLEFCRLLDRKIKPVSFR
jgi:hypothetical protein